MANKIYNSLFDATPKPQGSLSFDELLDAILTELLEVTPKGDVKQVLDTIARELRKQGFRFPKALVDAIHHLVRVDFIHSLENCRDLKSFKRSSLIDLLIANREFLESVYHSGRFLPPFRISFDDVAAKLQVLARNLLASVGMRRNFGDLVQISYGKRGFGYTDAIVILLPVGRREVHLIAATVRKRRWYIPPSKADENFREFRRRVQKILKRHPEARKIANETYVMVGRYTKGVKGFFRRKGLSRSKQAILVFDDRNRPWFMLLVRFLRNLIRRRLDRQMEALGGREPFGEVAERTRFFSAYLGVFDSFLRGVDV